MAWALSKAMTPRFWLIALVFDASLLADQNQ